MSLATVLTSEGMKIIRISRRTKVPNGQAKPMQSTFYVGSRCTSKSLPVHYITNTYRGNQLITHLLPHLYSFVSAIIETFCGVKPECIYRNYVDKGRTHFCLNCLCTEGLLMPLSPQVNGAFVAHLCTMRRAQKFLFE